MDEGYDPEWLGLEAAMGGRAALTGEAEPMTAQYNGIGTMLAGQWPAQPDVVAVRDEKVNEHVTVRIYSPSRTSPGQSLPVGLYFHGGGYIAGNLELEDPVCRIISDQVPCVIVSVDYRLAPQHKLPAAVDDGYDAYLWAYDHAADLNGDPARYFAIGGSAGGSVAFAVSDRLIRNGKRDILSGIVGMNSVACHYDNRPAKYKDMDKSYTEFATGAPLIDLHCMQIAFGSSEADPADEGLFPLISQHLRSFPPVYLATSEKDILRDDGVLLEKALRDADVKVKRDHYDGYPHYFFIFPSLKMSRVYLLNVVEGVKFVLGKE